MCAINYFILLVNHDRPSFSQELRYFEEDYDIRRTLEALVNSNPSDVKSWILLAKQRTSKEYKTFSEYRQAAENENHALNILSKALEANPYSEVGTVFRTIKISVSYYVIYSIYAGVFLILLSEYCEELKFLHGNICSSMLRCL